MNLKSYLKKAQKGKWAIGQFNFSTLSQLQGIVEAAKNLKSPIILGTSEGESRFMGLKQAVALKNSFQEETGLPIFLNLDHGKSLDYIKKAIDLGYDMVHFDGSKLPLEENIKKTIEVEKYAQKRGTVVEGEVGVIKTEASKVYTEKFEIEEEDLTNPEEAAKYIDKTGVECLAVSIGNFHGIEVTGVNPQLKLDKLKEIKKKLGNVFFVLHGGSGTPDRDIKGAIKLGAVKVNINTELRLAYTNALRKALGSEKEITPYKYLPDAVKAVQKVVEGKIRLFGSANKT